MTDAGNDDQCRVSRARKGADKHKKMDPATSKALAEGAGGADTIATSCQRSQPGGTGTNGQEKPTQAGTTGMARAASHLPAPTANPTGERADRLRAATAATRNEATRPRQGRTGDRYRRARLNSHRPLGVQAAIRSDRRPTAAQQYYPAAS
jgi:hypothetical protein